MRSALLEIRGDVAEGGGQIVRTTLGLSMLTGRPVRLVAIRAGRRPPGLRAQHLTAARLAARLTGARLEGDTEGSSELTFQPSHPARGEHCVDVGTAGSVTLLLQAVLLPCLASGNPVRLDLIGGTDVAWAPPADYFQLVLLPYYERLGRVEYEVRRRGFYPRGGGRILVTAQGEPRDLPPLELTRPLGKLVRLVSRSVASQHLREREVAERQTNGAVVEGEENGLHTEAFSHYAKSPSPGSVVVLCAAGLHEPLRGQEESREWSEHIREEEPPCDPPSPEGWPLRVGADCLGRKGLPAEEVGRRAARLLLQRVTAPQPVEEHLADNLIPFLGLFGGRLRCQTISPHVLANLHVVEQFSGGRFEVEGEEVRFSPPRGWWRYGRCSPEESAWPGL